MVVWSVAWEKQCCYHTQKNQKASSVMYTLTTILIFPCYKSLLISKTFLVLKLYTSVEKCSQTRTNSSRQRNGKRWYVWRAIRFFFRKWSDNKWLDKWPVHMIWNFFDCRPKTWRETKVSRLLRKDSNLLSYCHSEVQQTYGGVDIMDQRKVSYQFDNRSKIKYYHRVVFDLIDIAVNSSKIAFDNTCEE